MRGRAGEFGVIHMKYRNLIAENSVIDLGEYYISINNLKATITKSFKTTIIKESNNSFSCKIFRFARLYGSPVLFPNPIYTVELIQKDGKTKIISELLVYDYFIVYAGTLVLLYLSLKGPLSYGSNENIWQELSIPLMFFIFSNIAVLLDSKYFHHLLKRELKKEIQQYKV